MAELPGIGLITGSASGIGQATAIAFAQAGCLRMTLADLNGHGLEKTKSLILRAHPEAELNLEVGDICDESFVERMVASTLALFGRLDYAVNSAGIMGPRGGSNELPIAEHDKVMNVNYRGTALCSRAELRAMLKNELPASDDARGQRGAIVHIASVWGIVGARSVPAYCAAKGALIAMTKVDALDYCTERVRINCICPGLINTPLATNHNDPETLKMLEPVVNMVTPMRRMGIPGEVADAAVFLCSTRASFIQGHALPVDGGYCIH